MPIDFPANPTNGQVYSNYIYDSSITAWRNVNTDTGIGTLNAMGLKNIVPTSINVGSGSATVNSNGFVTFTGASSISLNGVFSSAYKHYRIIFAIDTSSTNTNWLMQLRNAGTNITGSSYQYNSLVTASSSGPTRVSNGAATNIEIGSSSTGEKGFSAVELRATSNDHWYFSAITSNYYVAIENRTVNGRVYNAVSTLDGATFLTSAGTFDGKVIVYGYNS